MVGKFCIDLSHVELKISFSARPTWFTIFLSPSSRQSTRSLQENSCADRITGANSTVVPMLSVRKARSCGRIRLLPKNQRLVDDEAGPQALGQCVREKINLPLSGAGEWRCKHTDDYVQIT
jgi:hypothetical protein